MELRNAKSREGKREGDVDMSKLPPPKKAKLDTPSGVFQDRSLPLAQGEGRIASEGHKDAFLTTNLDYWTQWWTQIEREACRLEKERGGFLKKESRRAERRGTVYYQKLFGFEAFWLRIEKGARKEEENRVELLKERKELKKADLFWNQFLRKKTTSKSKDTNRHEQKPATQLPSPGPNKENLLDA